MLLEPDQILTEAIVETVIQVLVSFIYNEQKYKSSSFKVQASSIRGFVRAKYCC